MAEGRDASGRFDKGNPGGPGRPKRSVELALEMRRLLAITEAVSDDDWREIVATAVKKAKAGDARARDWLTAHLVLPELESLEEWRESQAMYDTIAEAARRAA